MTRDLDQWDDLVQRVAAVVAQDYPEVEPEDISQHLYLQVIEHPEVLTDPDAPGVVEALWRLGEREAGSLRAQALHLSPQYAYRPSDVARILETTFAQHEWHQGYVPRDAVSLKPAADAYDLQSDISWGVSQLHETDRHLLARRYLLKESLSAEDSKRLSQAIDRLTEVVNSYPRPGHPRRVISNVRAAHLIGGTYE